MLTESAGSTGTLIEGNRIGTNAAGTAAIANSAFGVEIDNGSGTTIGGTIAGAGNLISGNSSFGIFAFSGSGALIAGNLIGTNAAGTAAIPNSDIGLGGYFAGVFINDAGNTIGGTAAARAT